MLTFITKRFLVMLVTSLCLTFVVFFLTNLQPNLEKLAKTEANNRMTDDQVISWLDRNGYSDPVLFRYGQWLGVMPGWVRTDADGKQTGRCIASGGRGSKCAKLLRDFTGLFWPLYCI